MILAEGDGHRKVKRARHPRDHRIYRRCRKNGITPRGLLDCLIVAVAWRNGATLLAYDIDLYRVAGIVGVDMDQVSLRG